MNTRFFFKSKKNFFGSSLFSMKPQNLKLKLNSNNITNYINSNIRKINLNNLMIADQINNYGFIALNFSNLLESKDEQIKNINEEILEVEGIKVVFFN